MACTPQLITLFSEIKHGVTSALILTQFEPNKPSLLKIDWSSEGMGWIMMQPTTDKKYQHASILLKDTGTCLFNL